jgi:hypothetical protein
MSPQLGDDGQLFRPGAPGPPGWFGGNGGVGSGLTVSVAGVVVTVASAFLNTAVDVELLDQVVVRLGHVDVA